LLEKAFNLFCHLVCIKLNQCPQKLKAIMTMTQPDLDKCSKFLGCQNILDTDVTTIVSWSQYKQLDDILLCGSRVTGTASRESDYDMIFIGTEYPPHLSLPSGKEVDAILLSSKKLEMMTEDDLLRYYYESIRPGKTDIYSKISNSISLKSSSIAKKLKKTISDNYFRIQGYRVRECDKIIQHCMSATKNKIPSWSALCYFRIGINYVLLKIFIEKALPFPGFKSFFSCCEPLISQETYIKLSNTIPLYEACYNFVGNTALLHPNSVRHNTNLLNYAEREYAPCDLAYLVTYNISLETKMYNNVQKDIDGSDLFEKCFSLAQVIKEIYNYSNRKNLLSK
jgi:predicted nucleotidyltransferase